MLAKQTTKIPRDDIDIGSEGPNIGTELLTLTIRTDHNDPSIIRIEMEKMLRHPTRKIVIRLWGYNKKYS